MKVNEKKNKAEITALRADWSRSDYSIHHRKGVKVAL